MERSACSTALSLHLSLKNVLGLETWVSEKIYFPPLILCRLLFSIVLDTIIIKSVSIGYKVILASIAFKPLENIRATVHGFDICSLWMCK